MKIIRTTPVEYIQVETDEGGWHIYKRYSKDNWWILFDESYEKIYDTEELEEAFQEDKRETLQELRDVTEKLKNK